MSSFSVCVPQSLNAFPSSSSLKAFIIGASDISFSFLSTVFVEESSCEESFSGGEWCLNECEVVEGKKNQVFFTLFHISKY